MSVHLSEMAIFILPFVIGSTRDLFPSPDRSSIVRDKNLLPQVKNCSTWTGKSGTTFEGRLLFPSKIPDERYAPASKTSNSIVRLVGSTIQYTGTPASEYASSFSCWSCSLVPGDATSTTRSGAPITRLSEI